MTSPRPLRLGTRGSQLALWQARAVATRIAEAGGPSCEIVIIKTSGDRLQDAPLSEVGGKRLFVKEIEDALLRDEIDLAVHSAKDLPALLPDGLVIAGVLPREDPHDVVVLPTGAPHPGANGTRSVHDLVAFFGEAPSIGTGSVRRIAQLTRLMPNARFRAIRGNIDTRLRKLDAGEHDALVVAAAGLRRLGFAGRISLTLPSAACVPAPGQGIVAIEARENDDRVRRVIAGIDDDVTRTALIAERAVVDALGGGCQTPIGALALPVGDDEIDLVAAVISLDGSTIVRANGRGPKPAAAALGADLGARLMSDGAGEILADARRRQAAGVPQPNGT